MNYRLHLFLSFVLFGLVQHSVISQVIKEDTSAAIKVFEGEQSAVTIDTIPTLRRVIHFGWLHPLRGQFPFFYEQAIGGYFAGSVGLGFTYADFFRAQHSNILFDNLNGKMSFGLHSEGLWKYYPAGLASEDFYFALNFKFSTFNYTVYEINFNNDVQERHYQYLLVAGMQFGDWNDVIVADYYLGVGLSDIYTRGQELVNIGGNYEPISTTSARGLRPIFRVGVKMGIRLK